MLTRVDLQNKKTNNEPITMVTAYDYPSAQTGEQAGIDTILVGDSLGMVVLGYESTIEVTLADMIHHAKAARRGAEDTFIVVDMPFMSYHISLEDSLRNARQLFQESRANALKVEGASDQIITFVERLTAAGIPVIGHLGLTPQMVNVLGGYPVQGRTSDSQARLKQEASNLTKAGAIAIVLECIPKELAKEITEKIEIPTIGIGSGVHCDGQVLVYHDLTGYSTNHLPKFVKKYANLNEIGTNAIKQYISEVKSQVYPSDQYSYE